MKRKLVVVLGVALLVIGGGAVAYAATIVHEKHALVESVNPGVVDSPSAFLADNAAAAGSGPLEVPVYREQDLVTNNVAFWLGRDHGFNKSISARADSFEALQIAFPSAAIRRTADGLSVYVMYDADAGGRLYLFFSANNDYMFEEGFPILMQNRLGHSDFDGIKVGDGIGVVEGIDSVIAAYRGKFDLWSDLAIENYINEGRPPTSVHLLTDGILKIEYRRDKALGYAITNIVYSPDFVLDGYDGKTNYKIDEADYVQ